MIIGLYFLSGRATFDVVDAAVCAKVGPVDGSASCFYWQQERILKMDLKGSKAVITGASSGIGEAIALELAARGACLTLTARRGDRLEELGSRISAAGGEAPLLVVADLRQADDIGRIFHESGERWGGLDILVNNAGLGRKAGFHDGATEDWQEMLDVNVLALAVACREALGCFDEQKGGHILNVSSMAGHRIPPGGGFYAATKFAVRAITECLRQELRTLGSPSRVSEISPGFVTTEFHDVLYRGDPEKIAAGLPQYRVLDPGDVAASVVHILEAPEHVAIHDILIRSNEQES